MYYLARLSLIPLLPFKKNQYGLLLSNTCVQLINPISSGISKQREALGGYQRPTLPNSSKTKDRDFYSGISITN